MTPDPRLAVPHLPHLMSRRGSSSTAALPSCEVHATALIAGPFSINFLSKISRDTIKPFAKIKIYYIYSIPSVY